MVNFYHRFLPNCAAVVKPLTDLLIGKRKHDSSFCWTEAAESAFDQVKCLLAATTVNFAYNDTRRGIRKVPLFTKCRYIRSLIVCVTVGWYFALGMKIMSLFANCRYIRSRYWRS